MCYAVWFTMDGDKRERYFDTRKAAEEFIAMWKKNPRCKNFRLKSGN